MSRRTAIAIPILASSFIFAAPPVFSREEGIYNFEAKMKGSMQSLSKYRDQNLNYPGLRTLREKYGSQGFNLIAFPCNQFGQQAPGTSEEERAYAIKKFGFEFDVYDKIEVNGWKAHPLYKYLKREQPMSYPLYQYPKRANEVGEIEWNYTKFLIDRQGRVVRRYGPALDPLAFEGDVVQLLRGRPLLPPECLTDPDEEACQF